MSRNSANNVSLFPFLAVLVCAMGALILLLLVTTRRIRSQQTASAIVKPASDNVTAAHELVQRDPSTAITPEAAEPLTAANPDVQTAVEPPAAPADILGEPEIGVADPAPAAAAVSDDLHALRQYQLLLHQRLAAAEKTDAGLSARFKTLSQERDGLRTALEQLRDNTAATQQQFAEEEETHRRLEAQLASLSRAVTAKDAEPVAAVTRFRIVPFDGGSGTIRRPIVIECVGDRFRFLPEGVELRRDELEVFPAGFNPLLSGAAALNTYWAVHDKQADADTTDPYLLLVVRPSGSLGFYAARRMLRKLGAPMGYELLGENQELDLPEVDSEAQRVCRLAVQRTLARSDEVSRVRPLAQSLLAQAARSRQRAGAAAGNDSAGSMPRDDLSEREEAFRRLLVGVRTENAPRPEGMNRGSYGSRGRRPGPSLRETPTRPSGSPPGFIGDHHEPRLSGSPGSAATPRSARTPGEPGLLPLARPQPPGAGAGSGPGAGSAAAVGTEWPGRPDAELRDFPDLSGSPAAPVNRAGKAVASDSDMASRQPSGGPFPDDGTQIPRMDLTPAPGSLAAGSAPEDPPSGGESGHRVGSFVAGEAGSQGTGGTGESGGRGRPTSVTDGSTKPQEPGQSPGSGGPGGAVAEGASAETRLPGQTPAQIIFRRAVDMFVDPDFVTVGDGKRIQVDSSQAAGPWLGAILTQVDAEVRAWGPAPMGMRWAPEIRFRISPGGNPTHTRIRDALNRLGIRSTDEFTLGPRKLNALEVFGTDPELSPAAGVNGVGK